MLRYVRFLAAGVLAFAMTSLHAQTLVHVPATPANLTAGQLRAQGLWQDLLARQAPVCDPALDSIGVFVPGSNKVAVVFHGVGSSPRAMLPTIQLLVNQGFNVFAPRLTGHFDVNLTDLDHVSYDAWVRDSDAVYSVARAIGPNVTVVGYSLGGVLASRLALKHYAAVERAILFAPAWRISPTTSLASMVGSIMGESLNHFNGTAIACRPGFGYLPAHAGSEIESLIEATEHEFGATYSTTKPTTSIFGRMYVPHIVITSPDDEALDRPAISAICGWASTQCAEISVPNTHHTNVESRLDRVAGGHFAGQTVGSIITRFLNPPAH